ncbi:hypothetical protein QGQ_3762 [Clostridioides difficile 342]|nr:hypothetical protein QCA_2010 [Clostridioides difficile CD40]EQF21639.1 hypothetical protein QEI_1821 [Clostridioides difficile CD129]EQF85432.1 hypothetical protein QGQ_3762 [Clostridioides difficile 342]EQG35891.1 hypothetical protein QIM_1903 [Clostridioides difficile DA00128]EQG80401.1 hypothetical protein QKC_1894 [Clostridioides difficile DA00167]EQH76619.1 hypothetical protein QMO_1786 [Clostridioides difficile DA00305]EQI80962.1 hypothetical protein QQK_1741 [Clostridioides diffici
MFLIELLVAFNTSTKTLTSYSLQSLNMSSASLINTAFDFNTVSHSNSSTDTFSRFAMATRVVRLTLEFPVSILLTCCGVTPILSATVSCVRFVLILAILILLPMALKSSSIAGTLLSTKVFLYIVTFVRLYYNGFIKLIIPLVIVLLIFHISSIICRKEVYSMIGFKKRDTKAIFKAIARQEGVSVAEVIREMEFSIEDAKNNLDPEKQTEFKRLFGNRTPTPEEFVYTVAKKLKY